MRLQRKNTILICSNFQDISSARKIQCKTRWNKFYEFMFTKVVIGCIQQNLGGILRPNSNTSHEELLNNIESVSVVYRLIQTVRHCKIICSKNASNFCNSLLLDKTRNVFPVPWKD